MRIIPIIMIAATVMVASGCGGRSAGHKHTVDLHMVSTGETEIKAQLKNSYDMFIESADRLGQFPVATIKDGKLSFSAQEKMVKPDYLVSPSGIDNLVTLSQKYRYIAILCLDRIIADAYDMPVEEYDVAIKNLAVSIADPAFSIFEGMDGVPDGNQLKAFFNAEYLSDRAEYFWEGITAAMVEQLYICVRDIDKFLSVFDDASVKEFCDNFVRLKQGITSIMDYYPDMDVLNNVLSPLYVIHASSVPEFRQQLIELKINIVKAREYLVS